MLPRWVQNRTQPGCPQIEKDQCAQVALALDNVVSSRLGFSWVECELEIQAAELGLGLDPI